MEFYGSVYIRDTRSSDHVCGDVEAALGLSLSPDMTGFYEEYPARVARIMGMEIAFLSLPSGEKPQFQVVVRPVGGWGETEVDVSSHVSSLLKKAGLECVAEDGQERVPGH